MKKRKTCFSIIGAFLILLFIVMELFLIISGAINKDKIPDVFGYKPFFVVSGSMESAINIGDLVIVKDIKPEDVKIKDIIAFRYEDYVITHRVVNIKNEDGKILFKTKGDNNTNEDDFVVNPDKLEGVMVKCIPKIGGVLMFLATPSGTLIVILLAIIVFGFCYYAFSKKVDKELLMELEKYRKSEKKKKRCKSSK